jgi:hypothetical protein
MGKQGWVLKASGPPALTLTARGRAATSPNCGKPLKSFDNQVRVPKGAHGQGNSLGYGNIVKDTFWAICSQTPGRGAVHRLNGGGFERDNRSGLRHSRAPLETEGGNLSFPCRRFTVP